MKVYAVVFFAIVCISAHGAKTPDRMLKKDFQVLDNAQKKGPGEKEIYARLIESYRDDDLKKTQSLLDKMLASHSNSIYADNALYLTGILQLKKGMLGPSVKSFDKVIKLYPKGNKRASALYAKGIAYRKLNLVRLSKRHLLRVIRDYPGSVESKRAKAELRLLKGIKKPKSAKL